MVFISFVDVDVQVLVGNEVSILVFVPGQFKIQHVVIHTIGVPTPPVPEGIIVFGVDFTLLDCLGVSLSLCHNLNPSDHICISEMKQKSAIEVNEKGTKAAVVTEEKIRVTGRGVTMENISFHATRPFAYIISEARTGTIIFMGTYYGDSI